jgi:hypothetical protein
MQTRRPVSVSTDRLGVTAMRCAHLLHRWSNGQHIDRTGPGRFVEVYPAAALVRWGLSPSKEASIAAHTVGFDPSLGIMHADQRYRGSLATDLMEPARPAADAVVLDLLQTRHLQKGDVFETREGVCRVGAELARDLARCAPELRRAVAPHAEALARTLSRNPDAPTPLTRTRHRRATAGLV